MSEKQSELFRMLKTPPLERYQVARWFNVSSRRVDEVLEAVGAEYVGRRVRILLREMPAEYLLSVGVLEPQQIELGQNRTNASSPEFIARTTGETE